MAENFSKTDKLRLGLRFCRAPFQVLAYVLRGVVLASARQLPLRPYVLCAVAKALQDIFDAHDIQYLCPPSKQVYASWVQQKLARSKHSDATGRLSHDTEPLEDGRSSILWIGDRNRAKKVVLFFHGGGYTTPLLNEYMEWNWRANITAGIETETEVAVAILEYSLAPGARYPTQLCQAASALAHLLSSGFSPKNIILGGDSAGGNLVGQLLAHLIWPHPDAVRIKLTEPLAGVFLVSPWLAKSTNDRSFAENGAIDMLSASFVNLVSGEVLGTDTAQKTDDWSSYAFPLNMTRPWIDKLDTLTNKMYLSVGYHEVLRDQCIQFVEEVRRTNSGLELDFDLQEKMAHDFILLECEEKRNGECVEAMKSWVKTAITADL
ncbi:unnamed protein product [Clonostachys rosea]|uniref:Alpha/beta hydrolase fold-3 domain-containing protein n=1 Tax=Bionectria ochroleuca TaxID=29856 RepID=A0ABY6U647_BIOOC|nr:unnamed protein product [Clonostachys rosea]